MRGGFPVKLIKPESENVDFPLSGEFEKKVKRLIYLKIYFLF